MYSNTFDLRIRLVIGFIRVGTWRPGPVLSRMHTYRHPVAEYLLAFQIEKLRVLPRHHSVFHLGALPLSARINIAHFTL